jgi:hypothetical protein
MLRLLLLLLGAAPPPYTHAQIAARGPLHVRASARALRISTADQSAAGVSLALAPAGYYIKQYGPVDAEDTQYMPDRVFKIAGEEVVQGFTMQLFYTSVPGNNSARPGRPIPSGENPANHSVPAVPSWPEITRFMDTTADVGMLVFYDLCLVMTMPDSDFKWAVLAEHVRRYRYHRGLMAWYLADEPTLATLPSLQKAYSIIKQLDPHHPVGICLSSVAGFTEEDYDSIMDVVLTDPYIIGREGTSGPGRDMLHVAARIDEVVNATGARKPIIVVPQAYGGGEGYPREPTAAEMRAQSLISVVHGAVGVMFFDRATPNVHPSSTRNWNACRDVALLLAQLTPEITSEEPAPAVVCDPPSVHARALSVSGNTTLLVVNTENRPTMASTSIASGEYKGLECAVTVVGEDRRVNSSDGTVAEFVDAYGYRVYAFPNRDECTQTDRTIDGAVSPHKPLKGPPAGPSSLRLHQLAPSDNLLKNPSFEARSTLGIPDHYWFNGGSSTPDLLSASAASGMIDPRLSVHGRHSFRLTTPGPSAPGADATPGGITLTPAPIVLNGSCTYQLGVWARSETDGVVFSFGAPWWGWHTPLRNFTMSGKEWRHFVMPQDAGAGAGEHMNDHYGQVRLRVETPGVAWFDMLTLIPLPSPSAGTKHV